MTNAAYEVTPTYPEMNIRISKAHQSEHAFRTAGSASSIKLPQSLKLDEFGKWTAS